MSSYWVTGSFEPTLSPDVLAEVEKLQPFVDYSTADYLSADYPHGGIDDANCTRHVFGFGWVDLEYVEKFERALDELLTKFEVAARVVSDVYSVGPEPTRYLGHKAYRLEIADLREQISKLQSRIDQLNYIAEAGAED